MLFCNYFNFFLTQNTTLSLRTALLPYHQFINCNIIAFALSTTARLPDCATQHYALDVKSEGETNFYYFFFSKSRILNKLVKDSALNCYLFVRKYAYARESHKSEVNFFQSNAKYEVRNFHFSHIKLTGAQSDTSMAYRSTHTISILWLIRKLIMEWI